MDKACRLLAFVLAAFLTVWAPERTSAFSLVGTKRCFLANTGRSFQKMPSALRTTNLRYHMKLDDTASTLKSEEARGSTHTSHLRQPSIFSRGDLLRASLLASVIAIAQPLLVAAASLVASQQYNRWWVFPLAPFANKKTVVSELVPDQVLLHPCCVSNDVTHAYPEMHLLAGMLAAAASFLPPLDA